MASSAQLRDVGGGEGEVIQVGLGVGPGCDDVCELASCVPGEMVWHQQKREYSSCDCRDNISTQLF